MISRVFCATQYTLNLGQSFHCSSNMVFKCDISQSIFNQLFPYHIHCFMIYRKNIYRSIIQLNQNVKKRDSRIFNYFSQKICIQFTMIHGDLIGYGASASSQRLNIRLYGFFPQYLYSRGFPYKIFSILIISKVKSSVNLQISFAMVYFMIFFLKICRFQFCSTTKYFI